jgi:antitoxin component of MazEF toxin-antitoxin module
LTNQPFLETICDMKSYTTTVTNSGDLAITIPQELSAELGIEAGTETRLKLNDDGTLEVQFLTETLDINLTNEELAQYSVAAHKQGITLNEYMLTVLEDAVDGWGHDLIDNGRVV